MITLKLLAEGTKIRTGANNARSSDIYTYRNVWADTKMTQEESKKKFKIISVQPIVLDTIFVGDWSRQGKFHTIENLMRAFGVYLLIIGGKLLNFWLIILGMLIVGYNIRPIVDKDKHQDWMFKFW
jgi:hypothetical protein